MIKDDLIRLYRYPEPIASTRFHKKAYVEGQIDYFVGISLPKQRLLAAKYYKNISEEELMDLLNDKVHEHRSLALIILVYKMKKATIEEQKSITTFYLNNINQVNNWDLVDLSAGNILGRYLYQIQDYSLLLKLSLSDNLWYKRISIVATWHLISQNILSVTLEIVDNLLQDTHDLIHKACGWMLRELGKKDQKLLTDYIEKHYDSIPRTMLRYAIEKYPETKRKRILKGDFLWR